MARLTVAVLLALALAAPAHAADQPLSFGDPLLQRRYTALLEELRCLVCQNQSLADSHADLAQDLRNEVYRMVGEGQDDDAILAFMVARYGDFVLYKPPLRLSTALLWAGPLLLFAGALAAVWLLLRRRAQPATELSAAERARLAALLAGDDERAER